MSSVLERFYDSMGNVVLRDTDGTPSIFVRHPKQKSNEFDPSLPDHTHPAFVVDGVEDSAVLWAKYLSSVKTPGGAYYSLPNAVPVYQRTGYQMASDAKIFNGGQTASMTIADYGLLLLMMHKKGIETPQLGNRMFGCDQNAGVRYEIGLNVIAGNIYTFRGYRWKCLADHTTTVNLLPDEAPAYWERIDKVGGTPVKELLSHRTGSDHRTETWYQATLTLTGSGPKSWYLFEDPCLEADMSGNQVCRIFDMRIVDGEIQVIPYNRYGDGHVSSESLSFKAILPNANDNGFTYVDPGTEGTVHYDIINSKPVLKAGAITAARNTAGGCKFNEIQVDMTTLPYVPYILYEYGLAPIPGTKLTHIFSIRITNDFPYYYFGQFYMYRDNLEGLRIASPLELNACGNQYYYYIGQRLRARELAAA